MRNLQGAILIALLSMLIGFIMGWDAKRYQIRERAIEIGNTKPLTNIPYTQEEIEYIIFGESQL